MPNSLIHFCINYRSSYCLLFIDFKFINYLKTTFVSTAKPVDTNSQLLTLLIHKTHALSFHTRIFSPMLVNERTVYTQIIC